MSTGDAGQPHTASTGAAPVGGRDEAEWQAYLERAPFHRWLGLRFTAVADGQVELLCPFREELVSDPDVPYLHGGLIATLLDIAGDYAIATRLGRGVPTVDMRVDFLRAAGREDLTVRGIVQKFGRSLSVADAECRNSAGQTIALGRILYSTR